MTARLQDGRASLLVGPTEGGNWRAKMVAMLTDPIADSSRPFPWGAFFLATLVVAIAGFIRFVRKRGESVQAEPESANPLYQLLEPVAGTVKAAIQMAVGIGVVVAVLDDVWQASDPFVTVLLDQALTDVAVGLAIAAAVELAYTLFTEGPDEALDPLMLAISSAMVVEVSNIGLDLSKAWILLVLGLLLSLLFAVRLFLAERHGTREPSVWWVLRRRAASRGAVSWGSAESPASPAVACPTRCEEGAAAASRGDPARALWRFPWRKREHKRSPAA